MGDSWAVEKSTLDSDRDLKPLANLAVKLGGGLRGKLGPPSDHWSVDKKTRASFGIPPDTENWRWAFPVDMPIPGGLLSALGSHLAKPICSFVIFGGFIYTDGAGELTQIFAFRPGRGMCFGRPVSLPRGVPQALRDAGRLQAVTIKNQVDQGARWFAFLLPREDPDASEMETKHGGFAFIFGPPDDPGVRAVYYPMLMKQADAKVEQASHEGASHFDAFFNGLTSTELRQLNNRLVRRFKTPRAAFAAIDADGSGQVEWAELRSIMVRVVKAPIDVDGLDASLLRCGLDCMVSNILHIADQDGDGLLTKREWDQFSASLSEAVRVLNEEE
eukprot:gene31616-65426_t